MVRTTAVQSAWISITSAPVRRCSSSTLSLREFRQALLTVLRFSHLCNPSPTKAPIFNALCNIDGGRVPIFRRKNNCLPVASPGRLASLPNCHKNHSITNSPSLAFNLSPVFSCDCKLPVWGDQSSSLARGLASSWVRPGFRFSSRDFGIEFRLPRTVRSCDRQSHERAETAIYEVEIDS